MSVSILFSDINFPRKTFMEKIRKILAEPPSELRFGVSVRSSELIGLRIWTLYGIKPLGPCICDEMAWWKWCGEFLSIFFNTREFEPLNRMILFFLAMNFILLVSCTSLWLTFFWWCSLLLSILKYSFPCGFLFN